ncbi:ribonuclease H-like domain-containing protein [Tanacetum coccineum]
MLKKSLYGLKQAPRQCNAKLTSTLVENGFSQSKSDYSLYTKSNKGVFLALLVYVDDIIVTGNNVSEIEKFKVYLKSKFMIKDLGKLKYFLGIEYGMLACKPAKTPLMSNLVISNEATENDPVLDIIIDYQKLIDLEIDNLLPVFLHCDNNSDIKIAANPVESANQIADILTKGLDTVQHKDIVMKLGMIDIYQVLVKVKPIDWDIRWLYYILENVMEFVVEKLGSSLARQAAASVALLQKQATLFEVLGQSSVSNETIVNASQIKSLGVSSTSVVDVEAVIPSDDSSLSDPQVLDMVDSWIL